MIAPRCITDPAWAVVPHTEPRADQLEKEGSWDIYHTPSRKRKRRVVGSDGIGDSQWMVVVKGKFYVPVVNTRMRKDLRTTNVSKAIDLAMGLAYSEAMSNMNGY